VAEPERRTSSWLSAAMARCSILRAHGKVLRRSAICDFHPAPGPVRIQDHELNRAGISGGSNS
jgi:hypothetical protein